VLQPHMLPTVEQTLLPYGARPHWGKLFSIEPEDILSKYPKAGEFKLVGWVECYLLKIINTILADTIYFAFAFLFYQFVLFVGYWLSSWINMENSATIFSTKMCSSEKGNDGTFWEPKKRAFF
jgi:hypothetical protein